MLIILLFYSPCFWGRFFPKAWFGQVSCPKNEGLGRIQTQIPKFGTENFETLHVGKCFLAQIPFLGDLGFGTKFLCCGAGALSARSMMLLPYKSRLS
jgi:hypothetical protein